MDHQGSPPAASASINGVWGVPSGNYALRTTHYSFSQTTPFSHNSPLTTRNYQMAKDKQKVQLTRQKKIAKQKAKAKAARQHQMNQGVPFEHRFGVSRADTQRAPVFGAWVSETIFENGMGTVIIARELDNGSIAAGIFLVDAWCLGVKNAFFRPFAPSDFEEMLAYTHNREPLEEQSPEYAAKLIGDVVDFSRKLGFSPHADYGVGWNRPIALRRKFHIRKRRQTFLHRRPS